jgi:hypothetical protein
LASNYSVGSAAVCGGEVEKYVTKLAGAISKFSFSELFS